MQSTMRPAKRKSFDCDMTQAGGSHGGTGKRGKRIKYDKCTMEVKKKHHRTA